MRTIPKIQKKLNMKDQNNFDRSSISLESQRNDEISILENRDLLTGEPRYLEDEIRNSKYAVILGGIVGVLGLIGMILAWIIYYRDRTCTSFWLAITFLLTMIAGFLAAAWGASTTPKISKGIAASNGMTLAVLALSLILSVLLFAATFWLSLYKGVHNCKITGWKTTSQESWNDHMPDNWTLQEGINNGNTLIGWLIFLAAVCSFLLMLIAYCAFTIAENRFRFGSYAVYIGALGMIIFGWLMIYWAEEAFEYNKYPQNGARYENTMLTVFKVLGIIGIVIGALAILARFLSISALYFLLAILAFLLFIFTISFTGLLLREVYQQETNPDFGATCAKSLSHLHQDVVSDWCPGKYLEAGQTCSKAFLTTKWEETPAQTASLNPGCCACVNQYYNKPYYNLGKVSLIFSLFCLITAAALVYLSKSNGNYGVNKLKNGLDFAFLALALLTIIGFGIYFLARKPNTLGTSSQGFSNFNDKTANDPNFERVHPSIVEKAAAQSPKNDGLYPWITDYTTPTFDSNNQCKEEQNCVIRAQVLARNAEIVKGDLGGANIGSSASRLSFFPGCTSKNSDFLYVYGTQDQVKTALENLKFKLTDPSSGDPQLLFNSDQVAKTSLNNAGMKNDENDEKVLSNTDEATCGQGFNDSPLSACSGGCQWKSKPDSTTTSLKGKLFYYKYLQDTQGVIKEEKKAPFSPGMTISAYSGNQLLNMGTYFADGLYIIDKIPVNKYSDYPITIHIDDKNNVFLEDSFEQTIPKNAGSVVSTGEKQLTTKDAFACPYDDTNCLQKQEFSTGNINVKVKNSNSGAPISGATVVLKNSHSLKGETVGEQKTDSKGIASFGTLPYGPYTATVTHPDYTEDSSFVGHQLPESNSFLILNPKNSNYKAAFRMELKNQGVDFDYVMDVRNPSGKECQVSPTNKYCAYAYHFKEANPDAPGQEIIQIGDWAVAKYKTSIRPSQVYSNTCAQLDEVKNVHYGKIDFSKRVAIDVPVFRERILADSNPKLYMLSECFTGYGVSSVKYANLYYEKSEELNDWSVCDGLIEDRYSLSNLVADQKKVSS